MALNSSGPISLGGTTAGQSIELENGGNGTTQISLNDTAVRALAGVTTPNSTIIMPTNFWGKSNYYTVNNSVRIRQGVSAYLARTPGTTSNTTTWTWSSWIKLGVTPTSEMGLFGAGGGAFFNIQFWNSTNGIAVRQYNGSVDTFQLITTQLFRDISAWYHIVVAFDSTQATASNRIKIYVNGSQVTAFNTASYPSLNETTYVNTSGQSMQLGRRAYGDNYWEGYFAEMNFVDGQALTPSSFGATNSATGVWQPAQYTGTYGTNGFYQKYSDIATTTASNAGLGKDFSGNGNYFVTNNISVTSGTTYDAMTDSPTWASSTVGNFCTLNPLDKANSPTASNANLTISGASATSNMLGCTMGVSSGKWYWETYQNATFSSSSGTYNGNIGVYQAGTALGIGATATSWGYGNYDGVKYNNNVTTAYGSGTTTGDIVMCALDMDNGKIWWGKNGTWFASGDPAAGTNAAFTNLSGTVIPSYRMYSEVGAKDMSPNFGQRPFSYTPPTGYKRLETYNLPTPTIGATSSTLANKYFDATIYTGNGAARSITNSGSMQPSMVWVKSRSNAYNNVVNDALRGSTKLLITNGTDVEQTEPQSITSFNSDGFSLGTAGTWNQNGPTYVAWQWNSPQSGSTNTAGSITSTVSANTTSGFSIVRWTYNSSGGSIGHGLGAVPKMIIQKDLSSTYNWDVYHVDVGATKRLILNTNQSPQTYSGPWNNTTPTSTLFYSGSAWYTNGDSMVSYVFAEVLGFSKFGSYTGNGSSDGTFVYTGFRPRYIMTKCITNGGPGYNWFTYDTSRNTYNVANTPLFADLADAQGTGDIDILSNGFKIRNSGASQNGSGLSYIYMAFAESPFNYSLAR